MNCNTLFIIILAMPYVRADDVKSVTVDIYPGFGWDNLRFLDLSPIFDVSNFNSSDKFQSCIEIIPVRQNKIQLDSTVVDMFDARTSDYSSNLFIGGSAGYMGFRISGSYSQEYQSSKKQQGQEKTIAFRNQIDYIIHDVILKSSCQLNPKVKQALIDIAGYQTSEQLTMATYAAQLFIKTYGTHFTSRLSLGGSIIQEDHIQQSIYYGQSSDKKLYRAAAEASFIGSFSLSSNFASSSITTDASVTQARKEFTRKKITAKGGRISLADGAIQSWQSSIDAEPTIVRRAIENITFFIQSDQIPELSEVELEHVREELNRAVETYIQMNIYSGCMNRTSSSFNWVASVDDGSCMPAEENSQFGGFIRTCTEDSRLNPQCHIYRMNNYYTNTEQCPTNFNRYLLYQSTQSENLFRRDCHRCGFLWLFTCCKDVPDGIGIRRLEFYGCNSNQNQLRSSEGVLKINNNYVYGGSFTDEKVNPVTGMGRCPNGPFKEQSVTDKLKVCLAERVIDTEDLPHYGGIYSCRQGNIAIDGNKKECPQGFSAYVMGAIEQGCLLTVCLKFDKFSDIRELPSIVLPPFFSIPLRNQTKLVLNASDSDVETDTVKTPSTPTTNKLPLGLSIGGIGVGILAVIFVTILLIQSKRRRRQSNRSNDVPLERTSNA